jgi:hypothetical protein
MTTIIKNEMFCNEILDVCVVNKVNIKIVTIRYT